MADWGKKVNEANTKDDNKMEWYDVIHGAVLNAPKSAYDFGANIVSAVAHPIETAKATGSIAMGALESLPGGSALTPRPAYDIEGGKPRGAEFDAMTDYFSDRYGSVEGFKKAVAEDPVGILADVATLLTGAGGGVRGGAQVVGTIPKAGKVAKAIEKTGAAIQKAGAVLEPTNVVKQATRVIPAERMYESAVKWNTVAKKPGKTGQQVRQALTKTALDHKIEPTYKGLNKLRDKLDILDEKISELIDVKAPNTPASGIGPSQPGMLVSADELLRHFDELEKVVWKTSGKPVDAMNAVKKIKKQFQIVHGVFEDADGNLSTPAMRQAGEMPPSGSKLVGFESLTPSQIQSKKVSIYKDLEKSYEKIMSAPASVKAQKSLARGAKDVLGELIPAIKNVNKSYGPLADLYSAIDQKAARISNYDLIPAATTWKTGAGYAATGGSAKGAAAGFIIGMMDTPVIKAKLAILVKSLQKRGLDVSAESIVLLGLYQGGKAREITER